MPKLTAATPRVAAAKIVKILESLPANQRAGVMRAVEATMALTADTVSGDELDTDGDA